MSINALNLEELNQQLRDESPEAIIRWALSLGEKAIMTTSFGYNSAVSLHQLVQVDKTVPVVWVDSGYNVKDAYLVADQLTRDLQLDLRVYNPLISAERRNALMGGIPSVDEPNFDEFVKQVKLEPFARALNELQPKIWLTGIRKEETVHRQSLDIVTLDGRGILKVAPIFHWTDEQVLAYMQEHQLPSCKHYFDPTKVHAHRECGLHTWVA